MYNEAFNKGIDVYALPLGNSAPQMLEDCL